MVLSLPEDTSRFPSLLNDTLMTVSVWPCSTVFCRQRVVSQTLTVWSSQATASFRPSGQKLMLCNRESCRIGSTNSFPLDGFQILIVQSYPVETSMSSTGLKATVRAKPLCPCNVDFSRPSARLQTRTAPSAHDEATKFESLLNATPVTR